MVRDRLFHNPLTARLILLGGALAHFALCWPLYRRRGFPEVDPILLSMIWMWVPPVVISAIFVRLTRRRIRDLIIYALATGFVVSWSIVDMVPSYKTWIGALVGLVIAGPTMIVGVLAVEIAAQVVLKLVRLFVPTGYCETCSYSLKMLTKSRCPECGTQFDQELLNPEYSPRITPVLRRWTTGLIGLLVFASIIFPFIYRAHTFAASENGGRIRAEEDWKNGSAIWFVSREEVAAIPEDRAQLFEEMLFHVDKTTNLEVREIWPDWEHRYWQTAYRRVIEKKLRESGRMPPKF